MRRRQWRFGWSAAAATLAACMAAPPTSRDTAQTAGGFVAGLGGGATSDAADSEAIVQEVKGQGPARPAPPPAVKQPQKTAGASARPAPPGDQWKYPFGRWKGQGWFEETVREEPSRKFLRGAVFTMDFTFKPDNRIDGTATIVYEGAVIVKGLPSAQLPGVAGFNPKAGGAIPAKEAKRVIKLKGEGLPKPVHELQLWLEGFEGIKVPFVTVGIAGVTVPGGSTPKKVVNQIAVWDPFRQLDLAGKMYKTREGPWVANTEWSLSGLSQQERANQNKTIRGFWAAKQETSSGASPAPAPSRMPGATPRPEFKRGRVIAVAGEPVAGGGDIEKDPLVEQIRKGMPALGDLLAELRKRLPADGKGTGAGASGPDAVPDAVPEAGRETVPREGPEAAPDSGPSGTDLATASAGLAKAPASPADEPFPEFKEKLDWPTAELQEETEW